VITGELAACAKMPKAIKDELSYLPLSGQPKCQLRTEHDPGSIVFGKSTLERLSYDDATALRDGNLVL
jgi:hypothetical protein